MKFIQHTREAFLDPYLIFTCVIFFLLTLPYIHTLPYLDGNIDFVQSYDFHVGGFSRLVSHWSTIHPPFKVFLVSLLFSVFGIGTGSYTGLFFVFGMIGILSMYMVTEALFDRGAARVATFLLATSGLFISSGLYVLTDFILTVLVLITCWAYAERHLILASVLATLAVLTKETGIILAVSLVSVEVLLGFVHLLKRKTRQSAESIIFLIPFGVFFIWMAWIKHIGGGVWGDWIFAETKKNGALYTVVYNLVSGSLINIYARENFLHLFILNFHWVFWLTSLVGFFLLFIRKEFRSSLIAQVVNGSARSKACIVLLLFALLYSITTLTFQTYTIPRYTLPVLITSFVFP